MSEPTPEAIEAAAKVIMSSEHLEMPYAAFSRDYPDDLAGLRKADAEADKQNIEAMREVARAALSAAAPYLIREAQAQALEAVAAEFDRVARSTLTGHASAKWPNSQHMGYAGCFIDVLSILRARAAAIRDGAE